MELQMIEEFQCPGCLSGKDTKCGNFKLIDDEGCFYCDSHSPATYTPSFGKFVLGLPKGFSRLGFYEKIPNMSYIRLWNDSRNPNLKKHWNKLNVPVWALVKDGYLFVRTYAPRNNWVWVDVVKDGTLELVPGAIDISEFYNEMD